MNNSTYNYQYSYTYYTIDEALTAFVSTLTLDYLNLYLYTGVSVIGFLLSLFNFIVLQDAEFDIPLYKYLRVYSVNSAMQGFINIFNFTYSAYRIFSWSNSYWPEFFYNYFLIPILNICYFYGSVVGIIILLDRITFFDPRIKKYLKLGAYQTCAISFVVCFCIEIPYFLIYVPTSATVHLNRTKLFTIWFSGTSAYAVTSYGRVISFVVFGIKDVAVMFIEIIMNIISVYLLRRHFKEKIKMRKRMAGIEGATAGPLSSTPISTARANELMQKSDQRATQMAVIMCVFSVIDHVIMLTTNLYANFYLNLAVYVLYFCIGVIQPFKCIVDFFVLIAFNKIFQKVCLKYLRCDRAR